MDKCILCSIEGTKVKLRTLSMYQCSSCSLLWRQTFDMGKDYNEEYDFDLRDEKVRTRIANIEDRIHTFGKYIGLDNVCDIGCGEGLLLKVLADQGHTNLVGIEPSKRRHSFTDEHKIDVRTGSIDNLDVLINPEEFKVYTMFHLIEHLPKPLESLRKLNSLMKSGDHIVLETPNTNAYSMKKWPHQFSYIHPHHLFLFNECNLKDLLEQAGFEIVAQGKRDFNQKNLSIRKALSQLGLLKPDTAISFDDDVPHASSAASPQENSNISDNIVRLLLENCCLFR